MFSVLAIVLKGRTFPSSPTFQMVLPCFHLPGARQWSGLDEPHRSVSLTLNLHRYAPDATVLPFAMACPSSGIHLFQSFHLLLTERTRMTFLPLGCNTNVPPMPIGVASERCYACFYVSES